MYSIKQLSVLTGIKPHTIRIWEKRYNLFSPDRTSTNIRKYSEEDLKLALNVKVLLDIGYKISHIADMPHEKKISIILNEDQLSGPPPIPESILFAAISLDKEEFMSKVSWFIHKHGFEWFYESMVSPLQKRMGLLWQAGGINPAQEHFASNLLRNIIIKETEKLKPPLKARGEILFYLPQGEQHEIGLLYFNYIALREGYTTIYLGQNVPIHDMFTVANKKNANILFTSFTVSMPEGTIENHFKSVLTTLPRAKIFATGKQIEERPKLAPNEVTKISSAAQFIKLINQ